MPELPAPSAPGEPRFQLRRIVLKNNSKQLVSDRVTFRPLVGDFPRKTNCKPLYTQYTYNARITCAIGARRAAIPTPPHSPQKQQQTTRFGQSDIPSACR